MKLNIGGSVHDPNDPIGRLLLNVLATIAEFESDLIRMRTREGMKVAKAKGRRRGKAPKLSATQETHLVGLYRAGKHTTAELAELLSVGRSTVYRAAQRAGECRRRRAATGGGSEMRTQRMAGRTVVVSGGASGVGLAAAKGLARLGARTIVVTRSEINGRQAMDDIRRDSGSEDVDVVVGDVGSRTGARLIADAVAERGRGVDVVVSAVGSVGERGLTPAGVPRSFATNYLTHFLLTRAMTPMLQATPSSRVLIVGAAPAVVRRIRDVRVDGVDPDLTGTRALTQSLAWKLLLARHVERAAPDGFTVNVFHPGLVRSNLLSSAPAALRVVGAISNRFAHTYCAVTDHLASDPTLTGVGGKMFDNRGRSVTLPAVVTDGHAASAWEASIALADRTD